jgi:hypothetical protein
VLAKVTHSEVKYSEVKYSEVKYSQVKFSDNGPLQPSSPGSGCLDGAIDDA